MDQLEATRSINFDVVDVVKNNSRVSRMIKNHRLHKIKTHLDAD